MSDLYADWVEVLPGKGAVKETARALLDIAQDARLVRTESNGTTFLVPAWVAERFTAPAAEPTLPETPKRRSRARKNEEDA